MLADEGRADLVLALVDLRQRHAAVIVFSVLPRRKLVRLRLSRVRPVGPYFWRLIHAQLPLSFDLHPQCYVFRLLDVEVI